MAIADESENLPNHSTGRLNPEGWRVIVNSSWQAHSESDELKTSIQTVQQPHQQTQGKRKLEETELTEAA